MHFEEEDWDLESEKPRCLWKITGMPSCAGFCFLLGKNFLILGWFYLEKNFGKNNCVRKFKGLGTIS